MSQLGHDRLVSQLISHIKSTGFTEVLADVHGYGQPQKIYWKNKPDEKFIPDITAKDGSGVYHIFEVETSDTITGKHTEDQWEIFSANAKSKKGVFVIYVESGFEGEAEKQVRNLGINAEVW